MALSRRTFLKLGGGALLSATGLGSYAFAIEPHFRLSVTSYRPRLPGWPAGGRRIRIAALADIHACEPWMPASRVGRIVGAVNRLEPDLVVLLGDYVAAMPRFQTGIVPPEDWARALAGLEAPLGTYAVLGNHDWWEAVGAVRAAFAAHHIPVLENGSLLLRPDGATPFWLAGLADQLARFRTRPDRPGLDDLPGTLAAIPDDGNPVILLAHEPDIFPSVPDRVSLTLCGHTHGGQVALPLVGRPVVPSRHGQRFAYGHIVEAGRHLIVSGGIGCTGMPVRFGVPPEIVVIDL